MSGTDLSRLEYKYLERQEKKERKKRLSLNLIKAAVKTAIS